jgi:hypothetical protein
METGNHGDFEPRLSPDFADRVMRQVGRIRARRRIRRRIAATMAVGAVLVAFGLTVMLPGAPTYRRLAAQRSGAASRWDYPDYGWQANSASYYFYGYSEDSRETTALNYMLPDAQSLMDFNNRYWNDSNSSVDYASWNS